MHVWEIQLHALRLYKRCCMRSRHFAAVDTCSATIRPDSNFSWVNRTMVPRAGSWPAVVLTGRLCCEILPWQVHQVGVAYRYVFLTEMHSFTCGPLMSSSLYSPVCYIQPQTADTVVYTTLRCSLRMIIFNDSKCIHDPHMPFYITPS